MPPLVQLTLILEPLERDGVPVRVSRLVEIPVGPSTTGNVSRSTAPGATADTNATQNTTSPGAGGGSTTSPGTGAAAGEGGLRVETKP